MKKIIVSFLTLSLIFCGIAPVSAAANDDVAISPRFVETWTVSGTGTHGASGYTSWTCSVSWDSRTGQTILNSVVSKSANFPGQPTVRISSYTTSPGNGGVIGSGITITYYLFVLPGVSTGPHTAYIPVQ